MRKLELNELQDLEYDILCNVADICEKNNLRYGLAGGTLLGAVRHGGFIPWDDDIDIEMPRKDFKKFCEIYSKKLNNRYFVSSPYNDFDRIDPYAKVYDRCTYMVADVDDNNIECHVYIDIFPIDGMPDEPIKQEKHRKKAMSYTMLLYLLKVAKYKARAYKGVKQMLWGFISLINRCLPDDLIFKKIEKIANRYDFDESKYASEIIAGYGHKDTLPRIVYNFDGKIKFRDRMFSTFRYPEFYLINIYGDYMEIPPLDKRRVHDNKAYMIE